jgi:PAS domain S-box-containing protein
MSSENTASIVGFAVLDLKQCLVHASGVAADTRVKNVLADAGWLEKARSRRLQALSLDGRQLVVATCKTFDGDLLVISEPPCDAVFEFVSSVEFAYDIIHHLLTDPFDAMTVVDTRARIAYISPIHERFFGLDRGDAIGRAVRDVIENTALDRVVQTGKAEIGKLQRMNGAERIVSRVPIYRGDEIVGAVGRVMFKGPRQVEALSRRINALENEVEFYRREAAVLRSQDYGLDAIIGESPAIRRLRSDIVKVAPLEIPVLIRGESGTGKELVAHALHRLSPRRDSALVAVNAAALPASLVEAELFGYEPGAFTGADRKGRKGKFEQAAGGSIFLDEIGEMPMEIQVKLLRVLQDRMVERIGAERPREVDFRLITATNGDPQVLVEQGKFRLDLYYRISPIVIEVPPLRERITDVPILAEHFLREIARRHARPVPRVSDEALEYLSDQSWPGNVRQLRHEMERAFVFAEEAAIHVCDFTPSRHDPERRNGTVGPARGSASADESATLQSSLEKLEQQLIAAAMARHKGNKMRVAQELGISRSYLYKKLDAPES